jgi:protein TonB
MKMILNKFLWMLIFTLGLNFAAFTQFQENALPLDSEENEEVFEIFDVSEVAVFKDGGEEGLIKFIANNVKYPEDAIKNQIEGMVNLVFVVDKKGHVKDIKIIGEKLGYGLEEEAIRVIKMTNGMWIPAKKREKNVAVRYRLPLRFQLN